MNGADFLVRQQASDAETRFRGWANQTLQMPTLDAAARSAAHPPAVGHLVRSMPVLWKSARTQAETRIEHHLSKLVDAADLATLRRTERALCGHWPRVARKAQDRIRTLAQDAP